MVQFILSFFMIIAAIVVSDQLSYMQTKDMGFDMNNVIVLPMRGAMYKNQEAVKNEFLNHQDVASGTLGYVTPGPGLPPATVFAMSRLEKNGRCRCSPSITTT